jgi:acetyltransferase-like isoleucine patch superfamily enzyme
MINKIKIFIEVFVDGFKGLKKSFFSSRKDRYGFIDATATVFMPGQGGKQNVFLHENTIVHEFHNFITQEGKFVMKKNSIAALGLTVITAEHGVSNIGDYPGGQGWSDLQGSDVIVDEDVWIGAHVTLCAGTHIQRGAIVATGSICVKSKAYVPYSIVGGNPAKFIKFRFTLDEQIAHEKIRFHETERIATDVLEKNYRNLTKS